MISLGSLVDADYEHCLQIADVEEVTDKIINGPRVEDDKAQPLGRSRPSSLRNDAIAE